MSPLVRDYFRIPVSVQLRIVKQDSGSGNLCRGYDCQGPGTLLTLVTLVQGTLLTPITLV